MKMRELAQEVMFASEVHTDATLDEAIQRALNESRSKKSIVDFLRRRDDRFFSSVVVAALGGRPQFYPVQITDDPQFRVFKDQGLDEAFGVLTFSGGQKYYALDGQHRLKAIKTLLSPEEGGGAPEGFADEEISVLLIVHREGEDSLEFRKKYRRLFSSLNRYAKATDPDTNIIMDEDDVFAILTRRLISEHEFFRAAGRQKESFRVLTKGKNMQSGLTQFTTLQTLYAMNEQLLSSSARENEGWGSSASGAKEKEREKFKRFRPDEEYIDELYDELSMYWNALIKALPLLTADPGKHRQHSKDCYDSEEFHDLLVFWPIGQELLARVARQLLDGKLPDVNAPTEEECFEALAGFGRIDWELHRAPWRHLVLMGDGEGNFKMRSEERKEAMRVAGRILTWLLGLDDLTKSDVEQLKSDWSAKLLPPPGKDVVDEMWKTIERSRRS
jgi:DGQHR domain-containing protein